MLFFLLFPVIVVAVVGMTCLNFKIGFIVGDMTAHTGFDMGFYMMTVFGLTAVEISIAVYILSVVFG